MRRGDHLPHSTRTPTSFTHFAHVFTSFASCLLSSCGELPTYSAPISVNRVCTSGRLNTFTISAFSLLTIGAGVAAGAITPYHSLMSSPGGGGTPDSMDVGVAGSAGIRFSLVTAIGLT